MSVRVSRSFHAVKGLAEGCTVTVRDSDSAKMVEHDVCHRPEVTEGESVAECAESSLSNLAPFKTNGNGRAFRPAKCT